MHDLLYYSYTAKLNSKKSEKLTSTKTKTSNCKHRNSKRGRPRKHIVGPYMVKIYLYKSMQCLFGNFNLKDDSI